MISSIRIAWKIGFSSALSLESVYTAEKKLWQFKLGTTNFDLQKAFRRGFQQGKELLRITLKEKAKANG
jgi:hypothetical protein